MVKINSTIVTIVVLFILLVFILFLTVTEMIQFEVGALLFRLSLIVIMIIIGYKAGKTYKETKKLSIKLGTESEWIRVGLIILSITCIPILLLLISLDYMLYGILFMPLCFYLVYLTRIYKKLK
jgi:membrane protease YdiL (CAAX protease family)